MKSVSYRELGSAESSGGPPDRLRMWPCTLREGTSGCARRFQKRCTAHCMGSSCSPLTSCCAASSSCSTKMAAGEAGTGASRGTANTAEWQRRCCRLLLPPLPPLGLPAAQPAQPARQPSLQPAHLVEDSVEGSVKQRRLLRQREGQPLGHQPLSLQHARYAGQRVGRHRAAAGRQGQQVP